jgi:hypothetical protein
MPMLSNNNHQQLIEAVRQNIHLREALPDVIKNKKNLRDWSYARKQNHAAFKRLIEEYDDEEKNKGR